MTTAAEILSIPCKISPYSVGADGYVRISVNGKTEYQHRLVYCIANNTSLKAVKGRKIIQMCGNHNCINPLHLSMLPGLQYKLL